MKENKIREQIVHQVYLQRESQKEPGSDFVDAIMGVISNLLQEKGEKIKGKTGYMKII
mgnify:CR=1 FL=1